MVFHVSIAALLQLLILNAWAGPPCPGLHQIIAKEFDAYDPWLTEVFEGNPKITSELEGYNLEEALNWNHFLEGRFRSENGYGFHMIQLHGIKSLNEQKLNLSITESFLEQLHLEIHREMADGKTGFNKVLRSDYKNTYVASKLSTQGFNEKLDLIRFRAAEWLHQVDPNHSAAYWKKWLNENLVDGYGKSLGTAFAHLRIGNRNFSQWQSEAVTRRRELVQVFSNHHIEWKEVIPQLHTLARKPETEPDFMHWLSQKGLNTSEISSTLTQSKQYIKDMQAVDVLPFRVGNTWELNRRRIFKQAKTLKARYVIALDGTGFGLLARKRQDQWLAKRNDPQSLTTIYQDTSKAIQDSHEKITSQLRSLLGSKTKFWLYHPGGDDLVIFLQEPTTEANLQELKTLIQSWRSEAHPVGVSESFVYKSSELETVQTPGDAESLARALNAARKNLKDED